LQLDKNLTPVNWGANETLVSMKAALEKIKPKLKVMFDDDLLNLGGLLDIGFVQGLNPQISVSDGKRKRKFRKFRDGKFSFIQKRSTASKCHQKLHIPYVPM
jgi:hypothetical protein